MTTSSRRHRRHTAGAGGPLGTWCGPCRIVEPGVERAAKAFAGSLKVVKVDVDSAPTVAARLTAAQSIPMLLIVEKGRERGKQVGAIGPDALQKWIEDVLAS